MFREWLRRARRRQVGIAAGLIVALGVLAGADGEGPIGPGSADISKHVQRVAGRVADRYIRTPGLARVGWGGLAACGTLGLAVIANRLVALRQRRVLPRGFEKRYLAKLREGKLDREKALDLCAMSPSAAARVIQAAVGRGNRPPADIERAVARAIHLERNRLGSHLGTLWRVAVLAPLFGLLGGLSLFGHAVPSHAAGGAGIDFASAIAQGLAPLTAGVALAIVALAAYDGLAIRAESLGNALEVLGAETVEAAETGLWLEPGRVDRGHRPPGALSSAPFHYSHSSALERQSDRPARSAE